MGVGMTAHWTRFLTAGQVPELKTAPFSIALHLIAEFGTALLLLISGISLLANRKCAKRAALVSLGMLLYAVIQAPGYFLDKHQMGLVGMFGVFFVLTVVFLIKLLRTSETKDI